ncbi:hypothetical protein ACFLXV_03235 [Chloroflexota bacterium]
MMGNGRERFTYRYYEEFLHEFRQYYQFTTFAEAKRIVGEVDDPLLIMRHDIDMDLEAASHMAAIENSLGIKTTYFFMVRCSLYNIFSRIGAEQVRQMLDYGHHFGLHFDCANYDHISSDNLDYYVSQECHLLEDFFGQSIEAVDFHRPSKEVQSGVQLRTVPNCYEESFRNLFEYFSDSRGIWRFGNPLESEAFFKRTHLHVCIHPIWWSEEPKDPIDCLVELVKRIGNRTERYLSQNCQVWGEGR